MVSASTPVGVFVALLLAATGCAGQSTNATTTTTTTSTTATSEPKVVMPDGVLAAQPLLHRTDAARGQFHVKLVNRSGEGLTIDAMQLVWDGFTTPVVERRVVLTGNQRLDLPLPFPGATCAGGGMPDVGAATVRLVLADGSERTVPVYDVDRVVQNLYRKDCERQMIDRLVAIEWVDLHEVMLDGRPVTEGRLRLTRREGTATIALVSISGTIVFGVEAGDGLPGELAVLAPGDVQVAVPVRFVEGRCDPHAIAEASQPFSFAVQLDIEGELHPATVLPPASEQPAMRQRVGAGCQALGRVAPVG